MAAETAGALDIAAADARAVVDRIFTPTAVRDRARAVFDLAARGATHFELHLERLDELADYTISVTRGNYPDLKIPYHSRHRHLRAGGVDRPAQLAGRVQSSGADEALRSMIDLVVVSVLLDAGAGEDWRYEEPSTRRTYTRSEGLAIASFDMFMAGAFSGNHAAPLRADIAGLRALTVADLERGLQVSADNPLTGAAGRVGLLNGLAESMAGEPAVFRSGRVSDLLDHVRVGGEVRSARILDFVLRHFGDIWPARLALGGRNLGDVWIYSPLGTGVESLIPFHKLSQWLTYSLIVPLIESGNDVGGIEELTGLAEYRNGGLMLDGGVIALRDPTLQERTHSPASEVIVEWRALTVALLDLLAERVRERLGMDASTLPLAAVLEGGTWHAGRKIAREKRPRGEPPLRVASDGTVF
jgi:hypothetical protein